MLAACLCPTRIQCYLLFMIVCNWPFLRSEFVSPRLCPAFSRSHLNHNHKRAIVVLDCIYRGVYFHIILIPPSAMSAEEIGAAFVQHFYTTLDSNPAGLAGLYVSRFTCNLSIYF